MFGILKLYTTPAGAQRIITGLIYSKIDTNGIPETEMAVRKRAFQQLKESVTKNHPILKKFNGDKEKVLRKVRELDEQAWCVLFDRDGLELGIQLYMYSQIMDVKEQKKRILMLNEQVTASCHSDNYKRLMFTHFLDWGFVYPTSFLKMGICSEVGKLIRIKETQKTYTIGQANYLSAVYGPDWQTIVDGEIRERSDHAAKLLQEAFPQLAKIVRTRLSDADLKKLAGTLAVWSGYEATKDALDKTIATIQTNCNAEFQRTGSGKSGRKNRSRKSVHLMKKFRALVRFIEEVEGKMAPSDRPKEFRVLFCNLPDFLKHSSDHKKLGEIWQRSVDDVSEEDARASEGNFANIVSFLETGFFSGALVEGNKKALRQIHKMEMDDIAATYKLLEEIKSETGLSVSDLEAILAGKADISHLEDDKRHRAQEAADAAMQSLLKEVAEEKKQDLSTQKTKRKPDSEAHHKKSESLAEEEPSPTGAETVSEATETRPHSLELAHTLKHVGMRQGLDFRLDELKGIEDQLEAVGKASGGDFSQAQRADFSKTKTDIQTCQKEISDQLKLLKAEVVSKDLFHTASAVILRADEVQVGARAFLRQILKQQKSEGNFHKALMKLLKSEDLVSGRTDGGRLSLHGLAFNDIEALYHGYRYRPRKPVKISGKVRHLNDNEALALYVTFSSRTEGVLFCISVGLWTMRLPDDPPANGWDRHNVVGDVHQENKIDPAAWKFTGQKMAVLHVVLSEKNI